MEEFVLKPIYLEVSQQKRANVGGGEQRKELKSARNKIY